MRKPNLTPSKFFNVGIPMLALAAIIPLAANAGILGLLSAKKSAYPSGYSDYAGDGKFTDYGTRNAANRFVVDLGAIDLTKSAKHEFKLGGLPQVQFNTGIGLELEHPFDVPGVPNDSKPDWFDQVSVKMRLADATTGKVVFEFGEKLSRYTWTNAGPKPKWSLLYNRGDFKPAQNNSMFVPKEDAKYKLVVEVKSKVDRAVPAQLLIRGGGWKVE